MSLEFTFSFDGDGCRLALKQPRRGLLNSLRSQPRYNLNALPKDERNISMALARLRVLDRETREHKIDESEIWISHHLASELDAFSAAALGLPKLLNRYVFKAEMRGGLGSPDFRIVWGWERGGRPRPLRRTGAIVEDSDGLMRLPTPILRAIEIADAFDPHSPLQDHWLALGKFRRALGADLAEGSIGLDGALGKIEVITSDRVGLQLSDGDDSTFNAVPFVGADLEKDLEKDEQPDTTNAPIKDQELSEFQKQVRERGAQPAYLVAPGKFLILDRTAMPVVQAISDAAKGNPDQRKLFIRDAERIISEAIERQALADGQLNELMSQEGYAETLERAIGQAWSETKEWASRVIGIGQWARPIIEQMTGSGTNWLPASMQRELGELLGLVRDDEVAPLIDELENAQQAERTEILHRVGTIPATADVIEALRRRLESILRRKEAAPISDPKPVFLPVTHSNFWDNDFQAQTRRRGQDEIAALPSAVITPLKFHQVKAFEWQVNAWRFGLPGILNADEQGLGKTLQSLAFLTWLAERMINGDRPMRPMLVVAPTSLLRNWEAELDAHISSEVWGPVIRLYGTNLGRYKSTVHTGRDIDDGIMRLDLSELATSERPPLAITTYQTLANYAVSFSQFEFAVAIFDEIQNVKNPATMRAEAAKAVNADFRIGLTGTPVENATRDIWAIMDQLFPGALGPLAEFRRIFDIPEEKRMRQLNTAIFTGIEGRPALGLRRLKKDAASDLPPKVRVLHPHIMPEAQAIRYDEIRSKGGVMFALLHHIRRTSLHPGLIDGEAPEDFTTSSARVIAAIEILADIKAKGERALVFVENRDVQAWFAELIKIEFGLERVYVINGDVGIDARKQMVDRFQRHLDNDEGFDVMVMGPRAAGTGLTLTAANHVIHLTRWWNPAVEEQCNDRTHRIGQTRPVTIHIPLAVHPRLGRNSFDCLLQRLMRRKRGIADAVLWPQESEERELIGLYQDILSKDEELPSSEQLQLADRPDLVATEISPNVLRVTPIAGGSSVIVAQGAKIDAVAELAIENDAAIVVMGTTSRERKSCRKPMSLLPDARLWHEYVLPE